jgi:nitrate/nitrite-specific signal transduction histidine kinase
LPSDFYENVEVGIRNTWVLVFVFFFIILFFNVIFVLIFISGILGPLQKLLKGIEEVKKGNLEAKVEINTRDELEILAREFNRMIKEMKEARERLEEEKLVLEIIVGARTKRLKELTEKLEKEVEERTKELKKRIEELEKFHQLTVGRELKMKELKEEIEKLREELKKCKIKEEEKGQK